MAGISRLNGRRAPLAVVAIVTVAVATFGLSGASSADVTSVVGSAYGHYVNVNIFGGNVTSGPAPLVTLPSGGSAPITAHADSAFVALGPAVLFSSGALDVSTQGTTGAGGSVTSTATVQNINTSGQEVFTAASVSATCTATETGVTGSTTITGGTLQVSETAPLVDVPTNPAPNTTYTGTIESVGDTFRYVFNEQIVNPDGSITVNAAHQYLLGPNATGDVIIGQVTCGVNPVAVTTTTTADCKPGHGVGDKKHCHSGPPGRG